MCRDFYWSLLNQSSLACDFHVYLYIYTQYPLLSMAIPYCPVKFFYLYMLPLGDLIRIYNISFHLYCMWMTPNCASHQNPLILCSLSWNIWKVIHAFITSRLDYCCSLCLGPPPVFINASAVGLKCSGETVDWYKEVWTYDPCFGLLVLAPINFRIRFKVSLIVFTALNGQAPAYIMDLLWPYSVPRSCK